MKTVAIFCHGQLGDCLTVSSVLKYKKELWGDAKIVWYIADENRDLLKYQDIELRTFPRGFGYPELVEQENKKGGVLWEDWSVLVDENNHLNLELKKNYPSLSEIELGYFPAPHQHTPEQRHGVDYPNISKKVFGVPDNYEWHPVLLFSDEEREAANEFMNNIGGRKKILFETFAGSGQSRLNEEMILATMDICNEYWEGCVFIFASHKFLKYEEQYPDYLLARADTASCAHFTVRECALISDRADLMISVSSGITVAASAWEVKQPPTLQFCGSWICSTQSLSHTQFELVTADDKEFKVAKDEYYFKLMKLLNKIQ